MPPTSIDGTDITGATIDGTDVQEITVDGQTVFTAQDLPVAYSNLRAWYPFDSAEYGGSNTDDVTAILGGSGDDSANDATVSGGTYVSSGGVTDINAGANSGGFEFDGSGSNHLDFPNKLQLSGDCTINYWVQTNSLTTSQHALYTRTPKSFNNRFGVGPDGDAVRFSDGNNFTFFVDASDGLTTGFHMYTFANGGNEVNCYFDGNLIGTHTGAINSFSGPDYIGQHPTLDNSRTDGKVDDVRSYNKQLTASEVQQIYDNTKP